MSKLEKENIKIPKRRFLGFTDAWEQRKLGEKCKITMGQSPDGNTYSDTPSDFILVQGNADLKDGWVYPRIWTTQKTKTATAGDLIMSVRAPAGTMGKTAYDVVLGRGVAGIKGDEFIFQSLSKMDNDGYWKKRSAGSTFESINSNDIKEAIIKVPLDMMEQQKIGEYFSNLDRLITLHQRKLEKLKNQKKAYLSEMFPAEGENEPKRRFSGFTGAWEQRKLGELVSFSKGLGYSKSDLKDTGTPIILYGRLYTKYETIISNVDTFADAKNNSIYSKGGEVIVPGSGETAEDISIASVVEKAGVLLGGDLNIITSPPSIDSAFLAISISNGNPHKDMTKMAQGKSVVHLHNSDLAKIDFPYPSYEEQCKISRSFSDLDHLITLHQRKLEKLKNLKRAYLKEMFI